MKAADGFLVVRGCRQNNNEGAPNAAPLPVC